MAYLILLVTIALIAGIYYYNRNKRKAGFQKSVLKSLPIEIVDPLFTYETVKGASVRTVSKLEDEEVFLRAIDRGLTDVFNRTKDRGYTKYQTHSEFSIVCNPPTYFTQAESYPALTMKNGMTIAGTVVQLIPFLLEPPFILIAENEKFLDYLGDAVAAEAEHIIAFYNDKAVFDFAQGMNDIHPIYKGENL